MYDDIARRVLIRINSVRKLAFESTDEDMSSSDGPDAQPQPCSGINNTGCDYDGDKDPGNIDGLCHSCSAEVIAAAIEEFLPWDLMEEKAPDLYRQYDRIFDEAKRWTPHKSSGVVRNWTDYPEVARKYQELATQIRSQIGSRTE